MHFSLERTNKLKAERSTQLQYLPISLTEFWHPSVSQFQVFSLPLSVVVTSNPVLFFNFVCFCITYFLLLEETLAYIDLEFCIVELLRFKVFNISHPNFMHDLFSSATSLFWIRFHLLISHNQDYDSVVKKGMKGLKF